MCVVGISIDDPLSKQAIDYFWPCQCKKELLPPPILPFLIFFFALTNWVLPLGRGRLHVMEYYSIGDVVVVVVVCDNLVEVDTYDIYENSIKHLTTLFEVISLSLQAIQTPEPPPLPTNLLSLDRVVVGREQHQSV